MKDGDVIVLQLLGTLHHEDVIAMGTQLGFYAENDGFDKILVDIRDMEYADTGARLAALQVARRFSCYNAVALVRGNQPLNTALVLMIARRSGRVGTLEVFSSRSEAVRWLRTQ